MDDVVSVTPKKPVLAQVRTRSAEGTAGRARSGRAADADSRREEILRLLGAPVAREVEMYARMRGLRPVDVIRAAVSHYLRQPLAPPALRAAQTQPRPRRAS